VTGRHPRPARYQLTFHLAVETDLAALGPAAFDIPDQRPQRFRLLYRQVNPTILDVLGIGPRDQHAIYRTAANRIGTQPGEP
jgi:hypothetical protein